MSVAEGFIAKVDDIAEGASKGFSLDWHGQQIEGFLVRIDDRFFAYRNSCPHTGAPLDWMPDQFLDADGQYIQCALHGALFQRDDGLCIYGPCVSRRLESLPIEVIAGEVRFAPAG